MCRCNGAPPCMPPNGRIQASRMPPECANQGRTHMAHRSTTTCATCAPAQYNMGAFSAKKQRESVTTRSAHRTTWACYTPDGRQRKPSNARVNLERKMDDQAGPSLPMLCDECQHRGNTHTHTSAELLLVGLTCWTAPGTRPSRLSMICMHMHQVWTDMFQAGARRRNNIKPEIYESDAER